MHTSPPRSSSDSSSCVTTTPDGWVPVLERVVVDPDATVNVLTDEGRPRLGLVQHGSLRAVGLGVSLSALAFVTLLSIGVGSKPIPLGTVMDALFNYDATVTDHLIVRSLRVPRTIVGLLVGVALGLAGAVMQGVTRNPLADPGILGVNAGAALFVVIGIYVFGVASLLGYVWFAFAGAAVASVVVYGLGSLGRGRGDPGQAGAGRRRGHRVPRVDHHRDPADRRRHARPVPVLGGRLAGRA